MTPLERMKLLKKKIRQGPIHIVPYEPIHDVGKEVQRPVKIMVGIVTSERHKHLLQNFMHNLFLCMKEGIHQVVVVDTSENIEYQEKLREFGFPVIKQPWYEKVADRIEKGRNTLRKVFLKSDEEFTHFLSLDSDIMLPRGVITKYLNWDKDLVTGAYVIAQEQGQRTTCVFARYKQLYTLEAVGLSQHPQQAWASGLGCMLIKRKVLEKIAFRNLPTAAGTLEDVLFCKDIRDAGFELWADLSALLPHFNLGWSDLIYKENVGK